MFIGDAAKNIPRGVVDYVVERVKGISGCDDQTFDRKYKSTLSEQLPTRITIAGNHVPRLFDDSGALASRLVVLPMNVSWYGREDPTLFGRLVQDIEGIAIWALQGLARLNQNGRFTIPAASQAETDYISEAYSPLRMFLDSACIMGGVEFVSAEDVYSTYKAWAVLNQEDHILPRRTFIGSFKDLTRGTGIIYGPHRTPGASPVRGFKGLTLRQLGQGGSIPLTAVK
jgi:phage/plasmid-associated DNA primase